MFNEDDIGKDPEIVKHNSDGEEIAANPEEQQKIEA